MPRLAALPTAAALLLAGGAEAVTLRKPAQVPVPAAAASSGHLGAGRRCGQSGGVALLAKDGLPTNLGLSGGMFKDGFSRVSCDTDVAPDSERISFKDHACGEGVKTCRLTELGMTPQICFDFCRQFQDAKFFGLQGQKCYCSKYYHAKSTGGGGCDFHCEGDQKEMCGGKDKSSLFEMHMCADSANEAEMATKLKEKAAEACASVVESGNTTVQKLRDLSTSWQLGVCSIAPEGQRACALNQVLVAAAAKVNDAIAATGHANDVLAQRGSELASAEAAVSAAGDAVNVSQATAMELATREVTAAAIKAMGSSGAANLSINTLAGPFKHGAPLEKFDDVFKPLGDVDGGWHAVCALEPVANAAYAAMADDDPTICGNHCLSMSTGVDQCVGFNYQYKDGLAACQLLTAKGIVEPADILSKAIPVFEVSNTKRDAMGIANMGCWAHGAFTEGHKSGPLKTHVVKEVSDA